MDGEPPHRRALPWLEWSDGEPPSRWLVIAAEELLDRAPKSLVRQAWKLLRDSDKTLKLPAAERRKFEEHLQFIIENTGREHRLEKVLALRDLVAKSPQALVGSADQIRTEISLAESVADIAILASPVDAADTGAEEPVLVTKGVLRVAGRFQGNDVDRKNRLTDGRLAIARMIGFGAYSRAAHLGLIELANSWCRPLRPQCHECPLQTHCREGQRNLDSNPTLDLS